MAIAQLECLRLKRRQALAGAIAFSVLSPAQAKDEFPHLHTVAYSPYIANAVTVTAAGTVFLGLPRLSGMETTPSLVRKTADGRLQPFPGGGWNDWHRTKDGANSFVMVNAIHIFKDGTLWIVDQGARPDEFPAPLAQKIVQLDPGTGKILRIIRLNDVLLPKGARLNDIRIHDSTMFLTDSGLGALILFDLPTGASLRRLSSNPAVKKDENHVQKGTGGRILRDRKGKRPDVSSDDIEIDSTGAWLFFAVPAGPLKKIAIKDLWDESLKDQDLAGRVQDVCEIPSIGGTCIDYLGNIYLSDAENNRILVLSKEGELEILIKDKRLISPDALYIDSKRNLYIPAPQLERLPGSYRGKSGLSSPFLLFSLPLPKNLGRIQFGNAVLG